MKNKTILIAVAAIILVLPVIFWAVFFANNQKNTDDLSDVIYNNHQIISLDGSNNAPANNDVVLQNVKIKDAVIISNEADLKKYKFDKFDFKEAYIANGLLNIVVGYGGGCKDHDFELVADKAAGIGKDVYPRYNFILAHSSNNDNCEAYIDNRRLSFNLVNFFEAENINIPSWSISEVADFIKIRDGADTSLAPFLVISSSRFLGTFLTPRFSLGEAISAIGSNGIYVPVETLDGWYIAVVKKEGNMQIISAKCYKVDAQKKVTDVGGYTYDLVSSFMATDVNPTNCYVGDPAKPAIENNKDYLSPKN